MRLLLVIFAVEALVASWIEISHHPPFRLPAAVEALVASWIEIATGEQADGSRESKPLWLRGLKYTGNCLIHIVHLSKPLWLRGLKFHTLPTVNLSSWSKPLWLRGLKFVPFLQKLLFISVEALVASWIEIFYGLIFPAFRQCRSPCGFVD